MGKVFCLRGLPGSGKTTLARLLLGANPRAKHVSADHFFVDIHGVYKFNPDLLFTAHSECLVAYHKALTSGDIDIIVLDNVNYKRLHMKPYHNEARAMGWDWIELTLGTLDVEHSLKNNIHGVPRASIERWAKEWER